MADGRKTLPSCIQLSQFDQMSRPLIPERTFAATQMLNISGHNFLSFTKFGFLKT